MYVYIIILVLILLAITAGAYYYFYYRKSHKESYQIAGMPIAPSEDLDNNPYPGMPKYNPSAARLSGMIS